MSEDYQRYHVHVETFPVDQQCYRNRERFKCNGVINYKKGLKYYKNSPLLAPRLQHMGKHAPLSLLTP